MDYEYGGDMARRSRDDGTEFTWFNWAGGTPINEEAQGAGVGDGALTNTYIGKLAELGGSNPATGSESYYMMDHLGSVRGIFDGADAMTGLAEFSPFGNPIVAQLPAGFDARYTVHHLDSASGLYYAPFRYLDPATGRWIKRDPLGMVDGTNLYGYVGGNPIVAIDLYGLWDWWNPMDWVDAVAYNASEFYYAGKDLMNNIDNANNAAKGDPMNTNPNGTWNATEDAAKRATNAAQFALDFTPQGGSGKSGGRRPPVTQCPNTYEPNRNNVKPYYPQQWPPPDSPFNN